MASTGGHMGRGPHSGYDNKSQPVEPHLGTHGVQRYIIKCSIHVASLGSLGPFVGLPPKPSVCRNMTPMLQLPLYLVKHATII